MPHQTLSESEVKKIINEAYADTGGDPKDIVQIKPLGGKTFEDALTFEVVRRDNSRTIEWRSWIQDQANHRIKAALNGFK